MPNQPAQFSEVRRDDGSVDIVNLAAILLVTPHELALSAGVTEFSPMTNAGQASEMAQKKLNELLDILEIVIPWIGDPRGAYDWYRSQRLPSFGDMKAEDVVKAGRTSDLWSYLARVDSGGYT